MGGCDATRVTPNSTDVTNMNYMTNQYATIRTTTEKMKHHRQTDETWDNTGDNFDEMMSMRCVILINNGACHVGM